MSDEHVEQIIVTVDDQHRLEIQSVATALQSMGMQVNNVLPGTGIITGEASQSRMQELKSVSGVVDVEVDQEMQAI
ncbi:MAG: hypothetical protein HC866_00240 [Leptolyngbyaceae cyanobacterium RU_5_1]|nr:hypothetical protein [Leptolyngbyaceae cyanobacterium RU_5_1]